MYTLNTPTKASPIHVLNIGNFALGNHGVLNYPLSGSPTYAARWQLQLRWIVAWIGGVGSREYDKVLNIRKAVRCGPRDYNFIIKYNGTQYTLVTAHYYYK